MRAIIFILVSSHEEEDEEEEEEEEEEGLMSSCQLVEGASWMGGITCDSATWMAAPISFTS